jgi:hypothetical protein
MKNPEIETALRLADEYAAFAPGKLFPKQMNADGDECYETITLPNEARARFLFPQLFVFGEKTNSAIVGIQSLMMAADAARKAEPVSGTIELRNRPEDFRAIHKARWESYCATLKPALVEILQPFQLTLIKERFGYRD